MSFAYLPPHCNRVNKSIRSSIRLRREARLGRNESIETERKQNKTTKSRSFVPLSASYYNAAVGVMRAKKKKNKNKIDTTRKQ